MAWHQHGYSCCNCVIGMITTTACNLPTRKHCKVTCIDESHWCLVAGNPALFAWTLMLSASIRIRFYFLQYSGTPYATGRSGRCLLPANFWVGGWYTPCKIVTEDRRLGDVTSTGSVLLFYFVLCICVHAACMCSEMWMKFSGRGLPLFPFGHGRFFLFPFSDDKLDEVRWQCWFLQAYLPRAQHRGRWTC